jgi:hypothetical protein
MGEDVLNGRRRSTPLLGQLIDPRGPYLDESEFGRNEEAIEHDEEKRDTEPPGNAEEIQRRMGLAHRSTRVTVSPEDPIDRPAIGVTLTGMVNDGSLSLEWTAHAVATPDQSLLGPCGPRSSSRVCCTF